MPTKKRRPKTDREVREDLQIPLRRAATLIGVSHPTLMLYEAAPSHVKDSTKRKACARFFAELRRLLEIEGVRV